MAVRFKFRSSVNFDSIDLNDSPSISIRDLRSKIVEQKNLKICRDFDLVICDAVSGQEYEDENSLVPSGSSVIIKRVPVERPVSSALLPIGAVENVGIKPVDPKTTNKTSLPGNADLENFDDFGMDFYPTLGESILDSDSDVDKMDHNPIGRVDKAVPRFSESSIVRCQNLEPSDISEAVQKGAIVCNLQVDTLQTDLKSKMDEQKKLDDKVGTCSTFSKAVKKGAIVCNLQVDTLQKDLKSKMDEQKKLYGEVDACSTMVPESDLPSELRCSLCNTIFKEAVMIPCCQHSFCGKCISSVLVEKARCPKCSSNNCGVKDLLPNLSLRQAIVHFLESQMLISGSDDIHPQYAPDGESGIGAKEVSCAISVRQRIPTLPHSPSVTGKGSNQVMADSAYELATRKKVPAARTFHIDVPANPLMKNKGSCANITDGIGSFAANNKQRKTCYMCDSPDHFVRDCPLAAGQYPMLPTGDAMYPGGMQAYGPSYWPGSPYPQVRPFGNMYATPGMMPYTPTVVPATPFRVPYMASMYGGLSVPCGFLRTGGFVPPMPARAERPVSQEEFMELQDGEQRQKFLSDHQKRERMFDGDPSEGYHYTVYTQRSHDSKSHLQREDSASYSESSDTQRSRKNLPYRHLDEGTYHVDRRQDKGSRSSNSGRDRRAYNHDISSSGTQVMSGSSNQHSKERHKHHQKSSKKHSERRVESDVNSIRRSHYQSEKEAAANRKKVESDVKRHSKRQHDILESGLESNSAGERKRQRKEKESSHSSKHSRHKVKFTDDKLSDERWEMIDGLDVDNIEDYYHHHKSKRRH